MIWQAYFIGLIVKALQGLSKIGKNAILTKIITILLSELNIWRKK